MIKNHKIVIELSDQLNNNQRGIFIETIINPLIKEMASNWPSIRITESKDDELI